MEVDERWLEVDVGRLEGSTFADVEAFDPGLAARLAAGELDVDWPAGERFADLEARVLGAFDDLRQRPERPVLIVTHAGPIAVLLRHILHGRVTRRFVGAGDAIGLEDGGTGSWTVRPVGIGSRP
jgi:broad specificity phosphatase PhoE